MLSEPDVSVIFPSHRSVYPGTRLPSAGFPGAGSSTSPVPCECSDSLLPIALPSVVPRWGYLVAPACSLSRDARRRVTEPRGSSRCPASPFPRGGDRVSQVPGEPVAGVPRSQTPVGRPALALSIRSMLPSASLMASAPRRSSFRGSIARPSDSLSTLRRPATLRTTQDSLSARWLGVGCAGLPPAGLLPRVSRRHRVPPSLSGQA